MLFGMRWFYFEENHHVTEETPAVGTIHEARFGHIGADFYSLLSSDSIPILRRRLLIAALTLAMIGK